MKGRARVAMIIGPALAVGAAGLLQGCASPAATSHLTASSATARTAVTVATARQVFASYADVSDTAAATGNEALALSVTAGPQWAQVRAQYATARRNGGHPARYRYGTPVFYVPRLTGFPEWFVVAVPQSTASPGTLAGQALLTFERPAATQRWRLTGTAQLEPGASPAAVQRDRAGYATELPVGGGPVLAPPDVVGPLQAAVVDDGPASPAAQVVAAGPLTTGLYAAQARQAAARAGYRWQLLGAGFTQFALRTSGGGALVFYAMYLNTPAARMTLQFAATDPPAGARNQRIQVIGVTPGE